jgi:hypothetical protein
MDRPHLLGDLKALAGLVLTGDFHLYGQFDFLNRFQGYNQSGGQKIGQIVHIDGFSLREMALSGRATFSLPTQRRTTLYHTQSVH